MVSISKLVPIGAGVGIGAWYLNFMPGVVNQGVEMVCGVYRSSFDVPSKVHANVIILIVFCGTALVTHLIAEKVFKSSSQDSGPILPR